MVKNKFQVKHFYQNYRISGMYIQIIKLLERDNYQTRLKVDWWKYDDATKKKIRMDIEQEMVIPENEYGHWILVS